jgi:Protein of unknown function, DUF481
MFRFVSVILTVLISCRAFGFINIETVRKEKGDGFFGRSAARVSGQKGNTNKFAGTLSSLNIARGERDEVLLLANYGYAQTSGVKDTNNGQAHVRYVFDYHERYAYEVFTQIEFDEFKDLNDRTLFGANVRQRLFVDEEDSFFAGYGGFYELEHYSGGIDRHTFRANTYLSFVKRLFERVSATSTLYYQPSVIKLADFRIRFEGGINLDLTKRLALELTTTVAHDNRLPVDRVHTDISYLTGLALKY